MAALMDSYQPKGIDFSQQYQSRGFDDPGELDEGDIVKSKPRGKMNYMPLVNEPPPAADERPTSGGMGAGSRNISASGGIERRQQQKYPGPIPPNGQPPAVIEPTTTKTTTKEPSPLGITPHDGADAKTPTRHLDLPERTPSSPQSETESDRGLDDSTTALLRRYTMERNGRPTSIHLGPMGEIVGSGWLSEILVTSHKKCSVTLEEDSITWRFLSRKDGEP